MAKITLNVEVNNTATKQIEQLKTAIKGIATELKSVKVNKDLTAQIDALTKNYKALANVVQKATKVNNQNAIAEQKLIKTTAQANAAKLKEEQLQIKVNTAKEKATKTTEKNTAAIKKNTESNLENRQSLLSMAQGFLQWQMAAMLVMKPLHKIQEAWASINETLQKTEDAVIALQRVLPSGSVSDKDVSKKLYDLAQKYGQTFENANAIALNFARTGMSWNETIQATESALLALNVAELDATQASDGMIAIMQQFGYTAKDLTGIIDILNKTADNYAVTTDKLLTALQRTGSSAKNANLSLEETVGLITALSEATGRSGENLGTAVNSLIQYSSKSSALDTFAKLNDSTASIVDAYRKGGATILDVWQEVSKVINSMDARQEGILSGLIQGEDITNLEQELQDELGDIFETVSDVYGTANTFRKNYFIALLGNMQTVLDATETARDAEGYSQAENLKYLDTYTAKVNSLQAQWEKLANDEQGLLGVKKTLVDIGSALLTVMEYTGGIRTTLIAISTIIGLIYGKKIVDGITKIVSGFKNVINVIKGVEGAALSLNQALGIIGLIATAVSMLVGAIQRANEVAAERRQALIDEYNNNKENARELQNLYKQYQQLSQESAEYSQVETAIVGLLEDKTSALKNLTKGTDEYRQAVLNLTEAELKEFRIKTATAQKAAEEKLKTTDVGGKSGATTAEASIAQILRKAGIRVNGAATTSVAGVPLNTDSLFGLWSLSGVSTTNTVQAQLQNYKIFTEALNALQAEIDELNKQGKYDEAEKIQKSAAFSQFYNAIDNAKQTVSDYFESSVENLYSIFRVSKGDVNASNYDEFLKFVIERIGADAYYNDTITEHIQGIVGAINKSSKATDDIADATSTWEEQSKKVLRNYEDLLDTINEMLNAQEQILDIEEKKKALEDARENRNVRVHNDATGNWELQADQNAISKAEKEYQDVLWKSIETEIKGGTLTVGEIYEKVKDISQDLPAFANIIREGFIKEGYDMPAFDNGGVLSGLGGIKATKNDEVVLNPAITRQILSPTSNEQFSAFVRDLGLLFGVSRQVANPASQMITNNGGNTTNDNRAYTVNGVPISQHDAEHYTLAELLETAATFNN